MDYFLWDWIWNELKQLRELNSSRIRRSKLHEIKCKQFFPGVFQWFKMEMKIKRCIIYMYLKIAFHDCFY